MPAASWTQPPVDLSLIGLDHAEQANVQDAPDRGLLVDEQTAEPDFGWMDAATRSLGEVLTPGTLVSYETTLPVGITRGRWKPLLEETSGLKEGVDFDLVF